MMYRTGYVVVAACILLVLPAPCAHAQGEIGGIRVEFHETRTRAGEVIREKSGSFFLGIDGRWRVDQDFRGERVSVITAPSATLGVSERIEINHDLGVVVRGPDTGPVRVPTIQGLGSTVISRPVPIGSSQSSTRLRDRLPGGRDYREDAASPVDLGSRAIGPLLLEGMSVSLDNRELELWRYNLPGGVRVTLEYTGVSTDGDGVQTVDARRITSAARVAGPSDTFSVPDRMQVYNRWNDEPRRER